MKQNILIFKHSMDCPPGTTTDFFSQNNWKFQELYWPEQSEPGLPTTFLDAYTGLVILGGPQNVDEEAQYPWLKMEKQAIEKFIELNKPILGICLGAQLIAEILGADVRRHTHTEAGWQQVQLHPEVSDLIPSQPPSLHFFQWHSYRFLTPQQATRFAENEITADQGFVYRNNIVGVQFHPEADRDWIEKCSQDSDYPQGPFVQNPSELLNDETQNSQMTSWYFQLLKKLFR